MQGSSVRARRAGRTLDYPGPGPKIAIVKMTDKKKPAPASMPPVKNSRKKKPAFHEKDLTPLVFFAPLRVTSWINWSCLD